MYLFLVDKSLRKYEMLHHVEPQLLSLFDAYVWISGIFEFELAEPSTALSWAPSLLSAMWARPVGASPSGACSLYFLSDQTTPLVSPICFPATVRSAEAEPTSHVPRG